VSGIGLFPHIKDMRWRSGQNLGIAEQPAPLGEPGKEKAIPELPPIREPGAPIRAGIRHLCKKVRRRLFNQVKKRDTKGRH
jgi:hypothetical protein